MKENGFWKVCEALDCEQRIEVLRYLLQVETSEYPCVNELAAKFGISGASMSIHLKKLSLAGLVAPKRADRRVYYRAFARTHRGVRMIEALRALFASCPDMARLQRLREYVHALSHVRRHMIVRCLQKKPGLSVSKLAVRTDMPPQTANRLWNELNKAHIVDLNGTVLAPEGDPEATLLALTLA